MEHEGEFVVFCDESVGKGEFFSNFYGGVLVRGSQWQAISRRLDQTKEEQGIRGEVKWQKVSAPYLPKYEALMTAFFDELRAGRAKVRIMFTQNAWRPTGLTEEDRDLGYFKLYYQFLKHAFGLAYLENDRPVRLRIHLDELPDSREKCRLFKSYLHRLPQQLNSPRTTIVIRQEDIAEVRSHNHVLLQCLDVVLGAMSFRLNNKHKAIPEGKRRRGKRTVAKEKLYKHVLRQIETIRPHFNIGISTGQNGDPANRWHHPYRHWNFRASEVEYREELTKGHKKQNPTQPT
jgi:hypothetical protein